VRVDLMGGPLQIFKKRLTWGAQFQGGGDLAIDTVPRRLTITWSYCLLVILERSGRVEIPWYGFATSHHYVVLLSLDSLVLGLICRMVGTATRQMGVGWRVGCRGVDWPCWCLLFRYGVGRGFVKGRGKGDLAAVHVKPWVESSGLLHIITSPWMGDHAGLGWDLGTEVRGGCMV
jgi:hypothetical protein